MSPREKSKIEKWLSFNRYKRRFNSKLLSSNINTDFAQQKNIIIDGDGITYTHGSSHDIVQHFQALADEFIGQSELCYTHAKIIVLIRRESQIDKHFALFLTLWKKEKNYLLKNLNTRWLVAAADTLADHSTDQATQALALNCSCLVNTIKLQETERFITNTTEAKDDPTKIEYLQSENRLSLFDGTSALAVGTDDTLRNMRWRINRITKNNLSGDILLEIFSRIQNNDTVYSRFKDRHTRKKTAWW